MSDNPDGANESLETVLGKLNLLHLDLRDSVRCINPEKINIGATCDVYRGKLRKGNGPNVEVAVKRSRTYVLNVRMSAKVFCSLLF